MNDVVKLNNLKEILIAIKNGDYDHFDNAKIGRAREELKQLLSCNDWDLDELLIQIVDEEVE